MIATGTSPRRSASARGALLLELVIALGITVGVGMTLLSLLGQSQRSLARSVEASRLADLASSAAAKIQAGLATADELDGPVSFDDPAADESDLLPPPPDSPANEGPYVLSVDTERAGVAGLTTLTVTANSADDPTLSFTIRRLVRLASDVEDQAIPESELQEMFDRATRDRFSPEGRRGGGRR